MWYVTGDTHGDIRRFKEDLDPYFSQGDTVIVLGDWGFIFEPNKKKEAFLDWLEQERPYYEVCFLDGNHENFHRLSTEYPVECWHGGKVHRIRNNIRHLMRGQIFTIEQLGNQTVFTMGGGCSFDRERRMEGYDWFPQELPSQEEYQEARKNLERVDYQVDYILTHTAPDDTLPFFSRILIGKGRSLGEWNEKELNGFLQWIVDRGSYKRWYFGHLHSDQELWRGQTVVLDAIRELETGRIVNG